MPKVSEAYLEARRRQILEAAARCFARDGFHRTSMQDVVRESGVSAGLVYRYFTGKDEMIAAIVADWHEQRRTRLAEDPAAAFLGLLRSVGDPTARDDARLGVQVWAEALRSPEILALVKAGIDGPRAAAATVLNGDDTAARVLVAIYQGLVLQTAWDEPVDHDAFARTVETLLPHLIRIRS
ncbi:TetR/AcrR family transcriptional regulator [Actinoplanes regularis]|uniref:TetR/AcrR family transcriptional regulator n=1 Tax=Actinoplanes regularis TaxID=52697 RepID=UPI00249FDBBF|nr:TetR/AcrR family transcriptional regulator [Actinoplanes regularis]GLW28166.1 TetR family transcriptional regulator [Actinoplanes regularis]